MQKMYVIYWFTDSDTIIEFIVMNFQSFILNDSLNDLWNATLQSYVNTGSNLEYSRFFYPHTNTHTYMYSTHCTLDHAMCILFFLIFYWCIIIVQLVSFFSPHFLLLHYSCAMCIFERRLLQVIFPSSLDLGWEMHYSLTANYLSQ